MSEAELAGAQISWVGVYILPQLKRTISLCCPYSNSPAEHGGLNRMTVF